MKPDFDAASKTTAWHYYVKETIGNMAEIWESGQVGWRDVRDFSDAALNSLGGFPSVDRFCCYMPIVEAEPWTKEQPGSFQIPLADFQRKIARYLDAKEAGLIL